MAALLINPDLPAGASGHLRMDGEAQLLSRSRAIQFAQVGQRLANLCCQPCGLRATKIDALLRRTQLEQLFAQVDELIAILAVPTELQGPSDLGRVPADSAACLFELRRKLPHVVRVSTGDVPNIGVPRDQPERGCARGADPYRRGRGLGRCWGFGRAPSTVSKCRRRWLALRPS